MASAFLMKFFARASGAKASARKRLWMNNKDADGKGQQDYGQQDYWTES